MNRNIVLMVALVTNFCVVGLTAGDPFIEKVVDLCPLVPPAYCLRSLKAVAIENIRESLGGALGSSRGRDMKAYFFYKDTTEELEYHVCIDCGECFLSESFWEHRWANHDSMFGEVVENNAHVQNPDTAKLKHWHNHRSSPANTYTCTICNRDVGNGSMVEAINHVKEQHPAEPEVQERYKQKVAAQLALAERRTTSVTLIRTDFKTVGALALYKGSV